MLLYERQQFEFFLQTAVERYVERLEQRFRGCEGAMNSLKQDPSGRSVWLEEFCEAVFEDFLLNNVEGACFILRALAQQNIAPSSVRHETDLSSPATLTVESLLKDLAKRQFSQLMYNKTLEALEQHTGYQAI